MLEAIIYDDPIDVDRRLHQLFGVKKSELLPVIDMAVAAFNESVDDDPAGTARTFAYVHGTRHLRQVFGLRGWERDDTEKVPATYNPNTGVKIAYSNVDIATSRSRDPKAVSDKGAGAERLVLSANGYLWPYMEEEDRKAIDAINKQRNATLWYFCVSIRDLQGEQEVCAELSCPVGIHEKQFGRFAERIFLVNSGDFGDGVSVDFSDDDSQEFEVDVSRKG